ncbi:hypothetical protein [Massilia sp. LC238]|jgi:hypothetical protein|uniref:hypothetical protein n=1 Tax=Massilia sp. LC238 TaxID=1502852 RepID=UPI0004E3C00E|nr:hypothetical protein [Massilia sp. LC238]KFC72690.1 hypothetical protein FG94_01867 [Massilia sp. LC238]
MNDSISLVRDAFVERLKADDFRELGLDGSSPGSVHDFIEFLTAGNIMFRDFGLGDRARFPDLTDLTTTFGDFLHKPVQINGNQVEVATVFRDTFCFPVALGLILQVAAAHSRGSSGEAALSEVHAANWREWVAAMEQPEQLRLVAAALLASAEVEFASRPLLSFFITMPIAGKFAMWGPNASSGQGRKLPSKVIDCDGYSVTTRVSRYEEVECDVTAYEWEATLTMAGASEPDAAACGMIYVFEREGGELVGGLGDLVIASDSMADADVIQVKSFITQHDDAADVIEKSDLCFVWIWERRGGDTKGLGAKCLIPALADLRRRFKKVRTVVFDARPGQFSNWTSRVDPPMVALEKQTAVENLVSYIQSLKLDFDVRSVFAGSDHPFNESLAAVGEAVGAGHDLGDDEDFDDSIDLDEWCDEIVGLLRSAGLVELANELEDDVAAYDEVMTAVKHIVFDSDIHYLRPSSSGQFDPAYVVHYEVVPLPEALVEIEGMDDFFSALPVYIDLVAIYWLDDYAVCEVRAPIPFGDLTEYFTLVRKPRPVNVMAFLATLA